MESVAVRRRGHWLLPLVGAVVIALAAASALSIAASFGALPIHAVGRMLRAVFRS